MSSTVIAVWCMTAGAVSVPSGLKGVLYAITWLDTPDGFNNEMCGGGQGA